MEASTQSPAAPRDLGATLERLTGVLAGAAVLVYLTGGLALQLRLGAVRLPSSAAVSQLPREFLVSQGLQIAVPAIAVAALSGWAAKQLHLSRRISTVIAIVAGLACYVGIGWLVVSKDPFPAKVCLTEGDEVVGVFIGETSDRTYLGDLASAHPRRVVSIPQSQVARLVIGGRERQVEEIACGDARR
jgi:hypothetical protein